MGRGKINAGQKIENDTNRQVTYSKRRKGLFKKADELSILCDAKVSIIMISSTGKLSEYISDSTTTKEILDKYQKTLGINLWKNKYENMQEELRKLKEINNRQKRERRHLMGEDLAGLNFHELHHLEEMMQASFSAIRFQHLKKIDSKTVTLRKKMKNYDPYFPDPMNNHVVDVEPKLEDVYGSVDNGGPYDSAVPHFDAVRLHGHIHHPNLNYVPVVEPHQFRFV